MLVVLTGAPLSPTTPTRTPPPPAPTPPTICPTTTSHPSIQEGPTLLTPRPARATTSATTPRGVEPCRGPLTPPAARTRRDLTSRPQTPGSLCRLALAPGSLGACPPATLALPRPTTCHSTLPRPPLRLYLPPPAVLSRAASTRSRRWRRCRSSSRRSARPAPRLTP